MNILVTLVVFALACEAVAQPYTLQTTTAPYVELSEPDFVIPDDSDYWANLLLKQNVMVKAFGQSYDMNEGAYVVLESGYLYLINQARSFTFYAFKSELEPRRGAGQTSEFSFKLDGNPGSKILKMQWKNMGLVSGTADEYANFQVWLYENGQLEVRFGAMNVNADSYEDGGPIIGVLEMTPEFSTIFDEAYLTGSAAMPMLTYAPIDILDGTPDSATVYTFATATNSVRDRRSVTGGNSNIVLGHGRILDIDVPTASTHLQVFDILGREVSRIEAGQGKATVRSGDLLDGTYLVHVCTDTRILSSFRLLSE